MSLLKILKKEKVKRPPIWIMRQAGRYLPEFRKLKKDSSGFMNMIYSPRIASKITLQPIKRFNLDSAIIFSDILMTPYALGQEVKFIKDQGPELSDFNTERFLDKKEKEFSQKLNPVYKAIEKTRKNLNKEKSLIAFIGAPWTLLVYMINIKKNKNEIDFNQLNKKNIDINQILNKLIKFSCIHIQNQVNAGADIIQVFDSWAGLLPENTIKDYCFVPNAKIVEFCKKEKIPNICFPKGIKERYEDFNRIVNPDGINLDYEIDPLWAKDKLKDVVIQGGLDPKILLKSEKEMFEGATKYIQAFKDIPYIFNLGHGLLPETDPDRVRKLIEFYRNN